VTFLTTGKCEVQLLILNEYAARYAVARHYLGLVDVDE